MSTNLTLPHEAKQLLEELIDRHSLAAVVEALSEVCDEKEDHVRTNWQDFERARAWHRASCALVKCATTLTETGELGVGL